MLKLVPLICLLFSLEFLSLELSTTVKTLVKYVLVLIILVLINSDTSKIFTSTDNTGINK